MTHEEFIKLLEERGEVVYILDRSLLRFGKFVVTIFVIFITVGLFIFGFDLSKSSEQVKKSSEEVQHAQLETQKAQLEMQTALSKFRELEQQLTSVQKQLDDTKENMKKAIKEVNDDLTTTRVSVQRTLDMERQMDSLRIDIVQKGVEKARLDASLKSAMNSQSGIMSPGNVIHIGLMSETPQITKQDLKKAVKSLQTQVSRDFQPVWNPGVNVEIEIFDSLDQVPPGYWPVIIESQDKMAGIRGLHMNSINGPYATIEASEDHDLMTLSISGEILGMLANPYGNRLTSGPSLAPEGNNRGDLVEYLVEVAQPVSGKLFGYRIDEILVSDFVFPSFFKSENGANPKPQYDYKKAAQEPFKTLKNGFVTWTNPKTGSWFQESWFEGEAPRIRELGFVNWAR